MGASLNLDRDPAAWPCAPRHPQPPPCALGAASPAAGDAPPIGQAESSAPTAPAPAGESAFPAGLGNAAQQTPSQVHSHHREHVLKSRCFLKALKGGENDFICI